MRGLRFKMKYLLFEEIEEGRNGCTLIENGQILQYNDLEKISVIELAYLFALSDKVISYGKIPGNPDSFRIDNRVYIRQ